MKLINALIIVICLSSVIYGQKIDNLTKDFDQAMKKENYDDAVKIAKNILVFTEKNYTKKDKEYIDALLKNALASEKSGDTARALNFYNEIYNAQLDQLSKTFPVMVVSLDYTRDYFHSIKKPEIAIDVYKKAIDRVARIDTVDYSAIMDITNYYSEAISKMYNTSVNTNTSENNSLETIKSKYGKNSDQYLHALDSVAEFSLTRAQYSTAKELYTESYTLKKNKGDTISNDFIKVCLKLGFINYIKFQYDDANNYYKEGIETWESSSYPKDSTYVDALFYYGAGKLIKYNYQGVIDVYKKAVDVVKKDLKNNHIMYSTMLASMAVCYKMLKNYDDAIDCYNKYYNVLVSQGDTTRGGLLGYYLGMGPLYEKKGEDDKAEKMYIKANRATVDIIRNLLQYISLSSEKRIAQNFVWFNYNLNYFYSFCLRRMDKNPKLAGFLYNNELIRKGLILRLIKSKIRQIINSGDEELICIFKEWAETRQRLSKLYILPVTERKQNVMELEIKCNDLETKMSSRLSSISYKNEDAIYWNDIKSKLKPGEVAIEFVHFDAFNFNKNTWSDSTVYGALIIRPEYNSPKYIHLFCEDEFQNFLNNNKGKNSYDQSKRLYKRFTGKERDYYKGDSLYYYVWEKIEPCLDGIKNVYYSPSGLLHKIAFNAIADADNKKLIKKYNLNQLSTTAILTQEKDSFILDKKCNALLYGGILYDSDPTTLYENAKEFREENADYFVRDLSFSLYNKSIRGSSWGYLKGTLTEVNEIDSILKSKHIQTKILTKDDAVEESLKYTDESPTIIHIATHGFFLKSQKPKMTDKFVNISEKMVSQYNSDDVLMKSGLLFAGANNVWRGNEPSVGLEDGILTAYEVSKLDLTHTRLVVLSACETGLGEIKGSEGVYGLQRSFKIAGVDYIIMSLWQIPDKQTVELMKLFYENWVNHMDIETAFHKAQLTMSEKYDPFFWAAFVLVH